MVDKQNMKWGHIARGVLANWLLLAIRAVIALTLVPLVMREVGADGYSIIVLVSVLVGLAVLADFGLSQGLSRELTEHCVRDDIRMRSVLSSTSLALYSLVALALVVGILIGKPFVLSALGVGSEGTALGGRLLMWFAVPSVAISLISPPFVANLVSINRFDLLRGYEMVVSLMTGISLLVCLPLAEDKLGAWIWATTLPRFIGFVLLFALFRRSCPMVSIRWINVNISDFGRTLSLGSKMYVVQVASMLTDRVNPIILSHFRGGISVATYQPGVQLSAMVRPIVGSLANQLHPATTHSHVSGDQSSMRELLFLGTRYTLIVGIGVCVIGIALAEDFCRLWLSESLGPEWQASSWVMRGCLMLDLCQYLGGVQWAVLVGMRRLNVMVITLLIVSCATLVATYVLMRFTSMGLAWVQVPAIGLTLVSRLGMAVYTSRLCRVKFGEYFVRAYMKPLIVGILLALACYTTTGCGIGISWMRLVSEGVFLGIVWFVLVVFVGLSRDERRVAAGRLRARVGRIKGEME